MNNLGLPELIQLLVIGGVVVFVAFFVVRLVTRRRK
jgi:hypothetical protein